MNTALCTASDLPGTTAPDWVHLLPSGAIRGRDGRRFLLSDPASVIAASRNAQVDLVIDYEHQADLAETRPNGPVPAAGWIKDIEARANGIWGRVEWTKTARNMISERAYRYLSPVIVHRRNGEIVRLKGASLVHRPNLELTALSSQEDTVPDASDLSRIAQALNMQGEADLDAILSGIATLQQAPDPARFVPVEAVQDLLHDRSKALNAREDNLTQTRVEEALEGGFITPAMKDWATALCRQSPEAFETFLSAATPAYKHLFERTAPQRMAPATPAPVEPLVQSVCQQLGLNPSDLQD